MSYAQADLGRVQESLKHYVRDWSEEGAKERGRIFEPILRVLRDVPVDDRRKLKVLVPGSGLGRLAWEISELGKCSASARCSIRKTKHQFIYTGFNTTAVEFSYFMTLGMRFLSFSNHSEYQPTYDRPSCELVLSHPTS